jgi:hypothetical protein
MVFASSTSQPKWMLSALNFDFYLKTVIEDQLCEYESGTCIAACDKPRHMSAQLLSGNLSVFPNTPSRDRAKLHCELFSTSYSIVLELSAFER